jgi:hypothetical protein
MSYPYDIQCPFKDLLPDCIANTEIVCISKEVHMPMCDRCLEKRPMDLELAAEIKYHGFVPDKYFLAIENWRLTIQGQAWSDGQQYVCPTDAVYFAKAMKMRNLRVHIRGIPKANLLPPLDRCHYVKSRDQFCDVCAPHAIRRDLAFDASDALMPNGDRNPVPEDPLRQWGLIKFCPMENPQYKGWEFLNYQVNEYTGQGVQFKASPQCNAEQVPDIHTVCIPCWNQICRPLEEKRLHDKLLNPQAMGAQLRLTDSCFDLIYTALGFSGLIRAVKKSVEEQVGFNFNQMVNKYTDAGIL